MRTFTFVHFCASMLALFEKQIERVAGIVLAKAQRDYSVRFNGRGALGLRCFVLDYGCANRNRNLRLAPGTNMVDFKTFPVIRERPQRTAFVLQKDGEFLVRAQVCGRR